MQDSHELIRLDYLVECILGFNFRDYGEREIRQFVSQYGGQCSLRLRSFFFRSNGSDDIISFVNSGNNYLGGDETVSFGVGRC